MELLEQIRKTVRGVMGEVAMMINEYSHGRVTPSQITGVSTVLHSVIAVAIIADLYAAAALMLVVFGLMDAVDGALARLQKSESDLGMILDATSDRVKEMILFAAIAVVFAREANELMALVTVVALGGSIIVSYVKAKAETVIVTRKKHLKAAEANRIFGGGLFSYEIRMAVLVLGLLSDQLAAAVIIIAVGSWATMLSRSQRIWNTLEENDTKN